MSDEMEAPAEAQAESAAKSIPEDIRLEFTRIIKRCRGADVLQIFQAWDKNRKGSLSMQEFVSGVAEFRVKKSRATAMFAAIDLDSDGSIGLHELVAVWTALEQQDAQRRRESRLNKGQDSTDDELEELCCLDRLSHQALGQTLSQYLLSFCWRSKPDLGAEVWTDERSLHVQPIAAAASSESGHDEMARQRAAALCEHLDSAERALIERAEEMVRRVGGIADEVRQLRGVTREMEAAFPKVYRAEAAKIYRHYALTDTMYRSLNNYQLHMLR